MGGILIVEDEFAVADQLKGVLETAGYQVCGIAVSVAKALSLMESSRPQLVLLDIQLKGTANGITLAHQLHSKCIPFIYLSANSSESVLREAKLTQPYGFLVKPFREKDLLVAIDIALFRHQKSTEYKTMELNSVRKSLRDINLLTEMDERIPGSVPEILQNIVPFDYFTCLKNENKMLRIQYPGYLRTDFREYQRLGFTELSNISGHQKGVLKELSLESPALNNPFIRTMADFDGLARSSSLAGFYSRFFRLKSCLCYPLLMADGDIQVMCFFSKTGNTYQQEHIQKLDVVRSHLEAAFSKLFAPVTGRQLTQKPQAGSASSVSGSSFAGIVGRSSAVLMIFDLIRKVAQRDTSVLILGENGTGKERIAKSIHSLSARKDRPFIIVNCASLPIDLIESELFGHEKGAFTGAADTRTGKFEMADGGTIFLDEIGEMPLSAQVKLLRVLQQREIERVGGRSLIRVDIRVIAATNRNLEKEVASGRFRMDLYYRLNVFPVTMPPLRDRKEDIPLLAEYFLKRQQEHAGGEYPYEISREVMSQLLSYDWPGNVRELENFIERAVVMTSGYYIDNLSLLKGDFCEEGSDRRRIRTMEENEREHIIHVLRLCDSKIYGPGGAAELLKIPPTTLASKMKKLGIVKGIGV